MEQKEQSLTRPLPEIALIIIVFTLTTKTLAHKDGCIIPFETMNLFYRDDKEDYLKQLQLERTTFTGITFNYIDLLANLFWKKNYSFVIQKNLIKVILNKNLIIQ